MEEESSEEDLSEFEIFEALVSYVKISTDTMSEVVEVNLAERQRAYNGFYGDCIDIGAMRTVVRKPQTEEYYCLMGITVVIKPSSRTLLKFGKHREACIGK